MPSEGFSLKQRYGIAINLMVPRHFGSKSVPPDSQWGAQSVPRRFPNRLKIVKNEGLKIIASSHRFESGFLAFFDAKMNPNLDTNRMLIDDEL